MQPVVSSTVDAVDYDACHQVLTVMFRTGATYAYYAVPVWLYEALLKTQPHPWSAMGRLMRTRPAKRLSPVGPDLLVGRR